MSPFSHAETIKQNPELLQSLSSPVSTMEDRISALPDEIIHHIFSSMNMPDVVHTSILSTRWKHLWLSTPTLKFRYNYLNCQYIDDPLEDCCSDPLTRCNNCKETTINHINFADRVLITRRSNLINFQMCNFLDLDANHLLTWFVGILGLHVQEIMAYFVMENDDYLKLPYRLFNPDIRVLELKFEGTRVFVPNSFSCATNMKILDLSNVRFQNDDYYDDEFVLNCPVLEILKLGYCDLSDFAVFTISTPLLERLELNSLYIQELAFYSRYRQEDGPCKVKAIAPNLRSLHVTISSPEDFEDCSSVDVCVEGIVSLVSGSISIGVKMGNEYVAEHRAQTFIQVLTGIPKVEVLKVSEHLIRVITTIPESLERLPNLFRNLKSLILMDEYFYYPGKKDLKVQEAVIFLERLPHIETLVWERRRTNGWIYHDENWVETVPSPGMFSGLKSFEYRNFVGSGAEQKFVEFLLGRAPVLNEMIIKAPRLSSLSGDLTPYKKKLSSLSRYGDKLLSIPRASPTVTISYQYISNGWLYTGAPKMGDIF